MDDAIEATQAVIDQLQVVKKAMMAELAHPRPPGPPHAVQADGDRGGAGGVGGRCRSGDVLREVPSLTAYPSGRPAYKMAAAVSGLVTVTARRDCHVTLGLTVALERTTQNLSSLAVGDLS